MTLAAFGPFAQVFERGELEVPGHLLLLGLGSAEVPIVLDRIATALASGESQRWLTALLHQPNWRPHLVAAVAMILAPIHEADLLWHAIDHGSWVIPQLVVVAAHVDPQFRAHARARVDALCPITLPPNLSPAERHSATGPEGPSERSAKMAASLLAMSAEFSDLESWRARVLGDERIQALLSVDASWNSSDKIVTSWLAALRTVIRERGQILRLGST